jgi:ubiquitin-like protein Pup
VLPVSWSSGITSDMAEQQKKEKSTSAPQEEVEEVQAKDLSNEALDKDVDDILVEIDDVLGEIECAEDWVMSFKQVGGQ